mmetsp:Transcript_38421/g.113962  ORF Transcript_38421/g.113962 Transcript_38421/m.113962 type:complete len:270 (-) Transcript_38421:231-1040(-)
MRPRHRSGRCRGQRWRRRQCRVRFHGAATGTPARLQAQAFFWRWRRRARRRGGRRAGCCGMRFAICTQHRRCSERHSAGGCRRAAADNAATARSGAADNAAIARCGRAAAADTATARWDAADGDAAPATAAAHRVRAVASAARHGARQAVAGRDHRELHARATAAVPWAAGVGRAAVAAVPYARGRCGARRRRPTGAPVRLRGHRAAGGAVGRGATHAECGRGVPVPVHARRRGSERGGAGRGGRGGGARFNGGAWAALCRVVPLPPRV